MNDKDDVNSANTNGLQQNDILKLMAAQFQDHETKQTDAAIHFLEQLLPEVKPQCSSSTLQSNQALQASALIGRKVIFNNNSIILGKEGANTVIIDIPVAFEQVQITLFDKDKKAVNEYVLKEPAIGLFSFSWDSFNDMQVRMQPGNYFIQANGIFHGQKISLKTMVAANVESVSLEKNGVSVKLHLTGFGIVDFENIYHIMQYTHST